MIWSILINNKTYYRETAREAIDCVLKQLHLNSSQMEELSLNMDLNGEGSITFGFTCVYIKLIPIKDAPFVYRTKIALKKFLTGDRK